MAISREAAGADAVATPAMMPNPQLASTSSLRQPSLATPTRTSLPAAIDHSLGSSLYGSHEECEQYESLSRQVQTLSMGQSQLTFFQRCFTKYIPSDGDDEKKGHDERQFSFLSIGSLVLEVFIILVLATTIAAVAVTTINHQKKRDSHIVAPVRVAISSNFPDPALLYENSTGTWYAFGTNNAAGVLPYGEAHHSSNAQQNTADWGRANIQMATSQDFVNWTIVPLPEQPLPDTGHWSQPKVDGKWTQPDISSTWAPAVIRTDEGKYAMYYTSARAARNPYTLTNGFNNSHPNPHCIGVAVSNNDSPAGPYAPVNEEWICPWDQGGAIDPEVIRDIDGTLYLVYKVDSNNIGSGGECGNTIPPLRPTPIMLQQLGLNGTGLVSQPTQILTNDGADDGPLVEAPMLIRSPEGIYFLFFSSGCTRSPSYNTKYATATHIQGPYTRQPDLLLQTGYWGLVAPGSIGIAADGEGGWNLAFQARVDDGEVGRVRAMYTAKLALHGHEAGIVGDGGVVKIQ